MYHTESRWYEVPTDSTQTFRIAMFFRHCPTIRFAYILSKPDAKLSEQMPVIERFPEALPERITIPLLRDTPIPAFNGLFDLSLSFRFASLWLAAPRLRWL